MIWHTLIALLACTLSFAAQNSTAPKRLIDHRPVKLSIRALELGHLAGSNVPVEVALLDAGNQPIAAPVDMPVNVSIVSPSQKAATVSVVIPKGQAAVQLRVQATEIGVNRLNASHKSHELFDANSSFLVRSPERQAAMVRKMEPIAPAAVADVIRRVPTAAIIVAPGIPQRATQADPTPIPAPPPVATPTAVRGSARLMIDVPDRGTGYLADGRDFALVSIYYYPEDGSLAPADIAVVLTASGAIVTPSRVIIKKDTDSVEAHVTSNSRSQSLARVSFIESFPSYDVAGHKDFSVRFVPPIHSLLVDPKLTLSLVDNRSLIARFVDAEGTPVQSGIKRSVWFHSQASNVKLKSEKVDVSESDISAPGILLPAFLGDADIEVSMDGYPRQHARVSVEGATVILMLVLGSICGGVCAYLRLKGSLLVRLFTGLIGGAVAVWVYVYVGLPFLDASVAHNIMSVLFVALIGGYTGTEVIDVFSKKLLKA
jgi:hypothetical protein